jgi:Ras GTPase-activating-like protein IQGAP2/3
MTRSLEVLYGNETNPREELLLLKYFEIVIEKEFRKADKITTAFTGVSAVVGTLNYFIRRSTNSESVSEILTSCMSVLVADKSDFELNILKVYKDVCEQNNMIPDPTTTTAQAMKDPQIVNDLVQRAQVLRDYAKTFLDAIIDGIESIPYGLRFVAKKLLEWCENIFPNCQEQDKISLLGGLIFVRWVMPVIVTPEMTKMVEGEVEPRIRRHLIMVTKVIHNLVNGNKFEDKQEYMPLINDFLQENKQRVKEFLWNVTEVEELDQHRKSEQYATHLKQDPLQIRIAVNETFKLHSLLFNSLVVVAPSLDDPLRVILRELGVPPMMVSSSQNKGITLKLVNRFDQPLDEEGDGSDSLEAIMQDTRWQLTRILRGMAPVESLQDKYNVDPTNLVALLSKAKTEGVANEQFRLADQIRIFLQRLNLLAQKKVYKHSDLLADIGVDLRDRDLNRQKATYETETLIASLNNIRSKRTYLLSTVSAYRESLLSARAVGFNPSQVEVGIIGSCCGHPTMMREYKVGPHRYSYIDLEERGFIIKSELPEQFRQHLTFSFESTTPGTIRLSVVAKQAAAAGMGERDSSIFNAQLLVEDLLEAKEKKIPELNLVELVLDLPQLIGVINEHFMQ